MSSSKRSNSRRTEAATAPAASASAGQGAAAGGEQEFYKYEHHRLSQITTSSIGEAQECNRSLLKKLQRSLRDKEAADRQHEVTASCLRKTEAQLKETKEQLSKTNSSSSCDSPPLLRRPPGSPTDRQDQGLDRAEKMGSVNHPTLTAIVFPWLQQRGCRSSETPEVQRTLTGIDQMLEHGKHLEGMNRQLGERAQAREASWTESRRKLERVREVMLPLAKLLSVQRAESLGTLEVCEAVCQLAQRKFDQPSRQGGGGGGGNGGGGNSGSTSMAMRSRSHHGQRTSGGYRTAGPGSNTLHPPAARGGGNTSPRLPLSPVDSIQPLQLPARRVPAGAGGLSGSPVVPPHRAISISPPPVEPPSPQLTASPVTNGSLTTGATSPKSAQSPKSRRLFTPVKAAMEEIKEELTCPVCMELLTGDPVALFCGHCLCRRCLMSLQANSCPSCRVPFPQHMAKSSFSSCVVLHSACDKLIDLERVVCETMGIPRPDKKQILKNAYVPEDHIVDSQPTAF